MKQFHEIKKKFPLFLLIGILILCLGFILINCGKGPQEKIANPDAGQFAIDLTDCPASTPCRAVVDSSEFKNDPSRKMAARELTAESWIKLKATSTSGAIFGRMDSSGIFLYIKNNVPKAIVRRVTGSAGSTSSVDLIVSSPTSTPPLQSNVWTHLAAVLSFPASATSTLDLYVNGQLVATSGAAVPMQDFTEPGGNLMSAGDFLDAGDVDGVSKLTQLKAIVDEPRLWGVARTQAEIQQCKNQELSLDEGTCGRMTKDLLGYLRFNEGKGETTNEWSGLGSGAKEYSNPNPSPGHEAISWITGWTTDTPDLKLAE